jgi:RNA polymerase sigma factor (TIGR02999 family)
MRLIDVKNAQHWDSRRHFFAAAAEAMRRILVENARRKGTKKHGGIRQRIDLDDVEAIDTRSAELLALDEALTEFAAEDPVKAQLVTLRYFGGLSVQQAADMLGISRATADRYWAFARTWLYCELRGPETVAESKKKSPRQ